MTSAIQTTLIDATFPTPGRDNDSQGFRTNFTAIKTALNVAKGEINVLQNTINEINTFTNTTQATSTNTGALQVVGGVGIGGDLYVGGEIHGTGVGVPVGTIVMWYGSIATIPAGWGLCDGSTYGTVVSPDLRNRFIIGAAVDSNQTAQTDITGAVTQTGGDAAAALPLHDHSYDSISQTPGGGGIQLGSGTSGWYVSGGLTTGQAGTSVTTYSNLPPYYALAFIIKLA